MAKSSATTPRLKTMASPKHEDVVAVVALSMVNAGAVDSAVASVVASVEVTVEDSEVANVVVTVEGSEVANVVVSEAVSVVASAVVSTVVSVVGSVGDSVVVSAVASGVVNEGVVTANGEVVSGAAGVAVAVSCVCIDSHDLFY